MGGVVEPGEAPLAARSPRVGVGPSRTHSVIDVLAMLKLDSSPLAGRPNSVTTDCSMTPPWQATTTVPSCREASSRRIVPTRRPNWAQVSEPGTRGR